LQKGLLIADNLAKIDSGGSKDTNLRRYR